MTKRFSKLRILDFGPDLKLFEGLLETRKAFFEILHNQLIIAARKRIRILAERIIGRLLSVQIASNYPLFFLAV